MNGGSAVKISAFQVQGAQEAVDALRQGRVFSASQSLAGDHRTIPFVLDLEGSQHPLQELRRPRDIVIGKDNDLSGDFRNSPGHLTSLVCLFDRHTTNPAVISRRRLGHGHFCLVQILVYGNQDELFRLSPQDRANGPLQLFSLAIQSRQDDGDILGGEGRVVWDGDGLESPE